MILSDKIWKLLEPATKLAENLSRDELEKNLYTGYYKLFTYKDSACVIAERCGWEKVLPDYKKQAVLLRKEIA